MAVLSITIPDEVLLAYKAAVNSPLPPDEQLTNAQVLKKIKGVLKDELRSTLRNYREGERPPVDMSDVEGILTD